MRIDKLTEFMGAPTCMIHIGGDPRFDTVMSRLSRLGSMTVTGSGPLFLRCPPESFAPAARMFVIDIDGFPDKGALVDALLEFRKSRPSTIVCLVSDKFTGIDIGTERLMICDGSVAKSMMSMNVVSLIRVLQDNNLVWQGRLSETKRGARTVTKIM